MLKDSESYSDAAHKFVAENAEHSVGDNIDHNGSKVVVDYVVALGPLQRGGLPRVKYICCKLNKDGERSQKAKAIEFISEFE